MTAKHFIEGLRSGELQKMVPNGTLKSISVAAALDCLLKRHDVPYEMYVVCSDGLRPDSSQEQAEQTYEAFETSLFGKIGDAEEYRFANWWEFGADMNNLRKVGHLIIAYTKDESSAMGMMPVDDNKWQTVGVGQLKRTLGIYSPDKLPLPEKIAGYVPSECLSTHGLWNVLKGTNAYTDPPYYAVVFPPEPK